MKTLCKLMLVLTVLSFTFTRNAQATETLMMATTTSTQDSGLLDYIKPLLEKDLGAELRWVAVGTGKALEMGKAGDVDVLLVHAPQAEKAFVEAGYGIDRAQVMYNDFVLVGPSADPAKVKGDNVVTAFKLIAESKTPLVSRGDDSGTNKKELSLWKQTGLSTPEKETWYISLGQGMMATLRAAGEKRAYTLTDRGSWIAYGENRQEKDLTILVEGDKALRNQYSVIMVNPAKHPGVKKELAEKFMQWWVSPAAQKAIADYRLQGKQLFFPNAGE